MSHPTHINTDAFESAVDAIINGDAITLQNLLHADPTLITQRSSAAHNASLIHYVAANGVEDDKQKTPSNIVDIATYLLQAGANPHDVIDVYGGTTALIALISSAHPANAGKLGELVQLFCQYGDANGADNDGMPLAAAIDFQKPEAIDALVTCGARVDNLVFAAATGNLDRVKQLMQSDLAPYTNSFGVTLTDPDRIQEKAFVMSALRGHQGLMAYFIDNGVAIDARATAEKGTALHAAIAGGNMAIVAYLLMKNADVAVQDKHGFTPLHRAAWNGQTEIVKQLLAANAPLEIVNNYGGTVLDSTVYAYTNTHYPAPNQLETLRLLLNAGADVSRVSPFPTGNQAIDAILRRDA